jgi:hypothetical protein
MPVDLAFTVPLTLIGLSAGRAASRRRPNPELPPSAAEIGIPPGPWYSEPMHYGTATPSIDTSEMTARFYPNGQLAELRGPAEVIGRAVLGLRELDHRAVIARTVMEQASALSRQNVLPPGSSELPW